MNNPFESETPGLVRVKPGWKLRSPAAREQVKRQERQAAQDRELQGTLADLHERLTALESLQSSGRKKKS